jgi:hypothetical protein
LPRRLVDKTTQQLVAIVLQRQVIADALTRYLKQLGLESRSKIKTLSDLLADEENDSPRSDPG